MPAIGLPTWRLLPARLRREVCGVEGWAALGAIGAVLPAFWMWGFTVDDALISIRYARHVASGFGWRFNAGGPVTDGVTPLPWPLLLAVFARADPLTVLARAKALGLAASAATGLALGVRVGRAVAPAWARLGALVVLALSVPAAAHAVSGMETSLATSLATFAVLSSRRPRVVGLLAGIAASLRPELAPWAVTVTLGVALARRESARKIASSLALAFAPFAVCALVRMIVWGRPTPLALLAKPSDLSHGLAYAGAACVVTLTPILLLAPLSLRRTPLALAIALAAVVHVGAIVIVGGDWMAYARLMVPIVPSLAWGAVLASERSHRVATAARTALALAVGVALFPRGAAGRTVGADRAALVGAAMPALRGVKRVACLDVGWLSASTDADIIDLGGVTDPSIAVLPGGLTSKRVDATMLLSRDADAILLYAPHGLLDGAPWYEASFPRNVEGRLARDESLDRHFAPAAWLPLGGGGGGYVLLRAKPPSDLPN